MSTAVLAMVPTTHPESIGASRRRTAGLNIPYTVIASVARQSNYDGLHSWVDCRVALLLAMTSLEVCSVVEAHGFRR